MLLCFFFNDTATTEIYTLSLHDALPISARAGPDAERAVQLQRGRGLPARPGDRSVPTVHPTGTAGLRLRPPAGLPTRAGDRKSTRLNSSHANISYAVFCLKKKTKNM